MSFVVKLLHFCLLYIQSDVQLCSQSKFFKSWNRRKRRLQLRKCLSSKPNQRVLSFLLFMYLCYVESVIHKECFYYFRNKLGAKKCKGFLIRLLFLNLITTDKVSCLKFLFSFLQIKSHSCISQPPSTTYFTLSSCCTFQRY